MMCAVQYRVSESERSVCPNMRACACARGCARAVMTSAAAQTDKCSRRPKRGSSIKVDACVCWQTLIQGCGGGGPLVLLSHCVPKDNARK
jgi:hypothetical protein